MLLGVQLLGILFSLFMVYLTFLYFKRGDYGKLAFAVWMCIWVGFLFLVSFPSTIYSLMDVLSIERTADFMISGFLIIFSVLIFKLYVSNKRIEKKMESIVRKVAFDKAYRRPRQK